jgi:guanylate kinase
MTTLRRFGVPVVVSAPSGGGKTTLCRGLVDTLENVELSVSHTTRAPRGRERDGADYHFVDDPTFDELIAENAFLEWAVVHGRRYGTSRREVEVRLSRGIDVLFDIDVQGGRQIIELLTDAVLVFVLPPSMAILEQRLRARAFDAADQIERRLQAAREEIHQAADLYSHWLVNDDLDQACRELRCVLIGERLRRVDRSALIRELLDGSSR